MFKQFDYKILCGTLFIGVLFVVGSYIYTQKSYEHFLIEIGESPKNTKPSEPLSEKLSVTSTDQPKSRKLKKVDKQNKIVEQKPIVETASIVTDEAKESSTEKVGTSEFDAASLLSAFGLPEEVQSILDEDANEEDFEKAQAHIEEAYGDTPEVKAIIDKLKQMSRGPVALDDLTELFEAWIQVLPEDQQETRRQLMHALTQLNMAKTLGGSEAPAIIEIEVTEIESLDD